MSAETSPATATIGERFPISWKLPEQMSPADFCEANRFLSARSSAAPGRYSLARYPYWREVMEVFVDPDVRHITIVAASQTGKTTVCENLLFYVVCVDPMPALWVFASEDLRTKFVHERLKPAIDSSPLWREHVSGGQWAVSQTMASFTTMPLFYGLAESESSLSSVPVGFVICDETGKYPASTKNEGSPIDQARARMRTFPRGKFLDTSTVTDEGTGIWASYKASDMREWMVPCPKCGERTSWERKDVRWVERPGGVSMEEWASKVRHSPDMAWWQCPACGHEVRGQLAKNEMNAAGVWIGRGYPREHVGFRLPSLATHHMSFHEYAAGLLKALAMREHGSDDALQHWTIHEDARPWAPKKVVIEEKLIADLVQIDREQGRIPSDAVHVTVGVDVQAAGFFVSVWAWSVRADKIFAHCADHGFVSDFDALLREFIRRHYQTFDGKGGRMPSLTFVDSGFETVEVYRFCNKHRSLKVFPTKGLSAPGGGRFFRKSREGGDTSDHRGRLVLLATEEIKEFASKLLHAGAMTFHAGVLADPDFQRHMSSEHRVEVKGPRGKRARWMQRDGYDANHYWDTMVEATGAAFFAGLAANNWRWRRRVPEARVAAPAEGAGPAPVVQVDDPVTGAVQQPAPKAETVPESRGTVRRVGWKPLPKRLW